VTLTIHTEEDSERQLKVTVEVPENQVQAQMRRTARDLARQVNIPGFRKGKVPYNILVQRVGEEALRADAVEEMLESVFVEALEEIEESPYRQPSIDDIEMKPLVLKITIPLEPIVKLGDYRAIRREIQPVEVTDEALEEALDRVRSQHEILEPVDRPAEIGDLITVSGEGKIDEEDGEVIWHEHETDLVLNPEKLFPSLRFVENLVGMSAGETKEFIFTFPEDYDDEELAGRNASFEVSVERVQSRELPEITDEMAQEEGEYETVEELREGLKKDLYEQSERQAKSDLLDDVVNEMMSEAEINYPPALVEAELDDTLANFKEQVTRSGWQWDDYIKLQSHTEESLRDEWREDAIERVRRGLVLRQFVEEEKLSVSSSEIDSAVDKRLGRFGENEELHDQLRSFFTQGQGLDMMTNEILMDKVQERVEDIVTGNAPDLEALEAAEEVDDEAAVETFEEEE
jgi:trigger factor